MNKPILVVMAAGMGSRYGGLKQIDPLGPGGQIMMDYSIYDAYRAGFREIVFIIKPELHDAFETAIGKKAAQKMKTHYVYQTTDVLPAGCALPENRTKPLGTGHAIYCIRDVVHEPFAVINADDFYGAEAFQQIFSFLQAAQDDDKYRYCMVGYQVENTLTENGTVSRGVCQTDANGFLTDITERTAIARGKDGVIRDDVTGDTIAAGTAVSMNLWGFTPSFLASLDEQLRAFLQDTLPQNPEKAEFYLPSAVDRLITEGRATAKVLTCAARWFGVTYQEDRPSVMAALQQMTDAGIYPADF